MSYKVIGGYIKASSDWESKKRFETQADAWEWIKSNIAEEFPLRFIAIVPDFKEEDEVENETK